MRGAKGYAVRHIVLLNEVGVATDDTARRKDADPLAAPQLMRVQDEPTNDDDVREVYEFGAFYNSLSIARYLL